MLKEGVDSFPFKLKLNDNRSAILDDFGVLNVNVNVVLSQYLMFALDRFSTFFDINFLTTFYLLV